MSQQRLDITSFSTSEGQFDLRDEFFFELSPGQYQYERPNLRTAPSFVTVKSNDPHSKSTTSEGSSGNGPQDYNNIPARFVELPMNGEGGSSGVLFMGKGKGKKPRTSGAVISGGGGGLGNTTSNMVSPGGGGMSGTLQKSQANAAFVSRIMAHEQLAKILAWRSAETTYIFYNVGRAFVWADYNRKPKEPLSYIVFKEAYVNCHDVNMLTRENMDTIIGFNTGDVMWYSPISGKFSRFNRGGLFNRSSVTCVKWMPGSENMFIAGYEDGSVITYDKEKDDQTFTFPQSDSDSFFVCKPHKNGKHNPASWWQVGRRAITAISFSPDCQHVAVTSMDGTMKVIDYTNERLLDTYRSFFGGLLCVCWSPDGRFILTGGQDDLVTVWAFRGRIVARCQGHHSWVTGVSFDAHRCTDRSYRFGSVGEDTRLCLWDFSVSSLHRPKGSAVQAATARRSRADFDKHTDIVHPVLSRREVALLEPFLSKIIHNEPLFSIVFREDAVVTTDRIGAIRVWARPPTLPS